MNGLPAGSYARYVWHRDGKYLLRLIRIDVSHQPHILTAVARYSYLLEIQKHAGYLVITINVLGSWLVYIGKRKFYVQRIDQEDG